MCLFAFDSTFSKKNRSGQIYDIKCIFLAYIIFMVHIPQTIYIRCFKGSVAMLYSYIMPTVYQTVSALSVFFAPGTYRTRHDWQFLITIIFIALIVCPTQLFLQECLHCRSICTMGVSVMQEYMYCRSVCTAGVSAGVSVLQECLYCRRSVCTEGISVLKECLYCSLH